MQIERPIPTRHRLRRVLVAGAIAVGALAAGSSVDAGNVRTTPPATEPFVPVTTPDTVPVTTPDTVPDNGGDSDVPWGWIIALGVVGIAIIAAVAGAAGRRRAPVQPSAAPPPRASAADQDRGYALGSAQWVHDHLAPELLAAPPAQAASRWAAERSRLDDTVIRSQQYTADPSSGISWQRLAQSLSLLGTSLDSYIHLRNQQPPNQEQIDESYAVAYQHHAELGVALSQLWPTVQR